MAHRKLWFALLASMLLMALTQTVYGSGTINSVDDVPPDVVAWIQENAQPFETPRPIDDHSDLDSLQELVGDAQVVSLGEATHGTAEFFWMKHRILRYLVEEMGFRYFMIEANYAESLAVNDYVLHGEGNAQAALSGLYFWTWNTQEVLDMIEWMREYNIANPDDPVQFLGFDAQFHEGGPNVLYDYLQIVDPERVGEVYGRLQCFDDGSDPRGRTPTPECRQNLQDVRQEFVDQRQIYVTASSEYDYELMLRVVDMLIQVEQLHREQEGNWRDEAMAQNIIWLTETLAPDSKVVLWAHNAHVQTTPIGMGEFQFRPMGVYLREHYGDAMVVMGFAFWEGSFRAYEANDNGIYGGEVATLELLPTAPDSHEFFFQAAGIPHYFLDVRDVSPTSAGADWLDHAYNLQLIGAVYNTESGAGSYLPTHLPDNYDVMIFIEESTPTERVWFEYDF